MGSSTNIANNQILTLDFAVSEKDFEGGAKRVLQHVFPAWKPERLKFKVFTDGITNKLLGCYQDDDPQNIVLVRINGEGTDTIINRKEELENFAILSANDCAPVLHAVFENGIAYGFFHGTPLDEKSVREPKLQRLIAEEMVRLHQIKGGKGLKGDASPEYKDRLQSYLDSLPTSFDDADKQEDFLKKIPSKTDLLKEFTLVMEQLEELKMGTVFSHNDLLLKNIIYDDKEGAIHFIDYEYAFYNYAAYDIGNHFTEYAGITDIDYNLYPSKEEQWPFLKHYLLSKAKVNGKSEDSVNEKDVERLYVQVNKCACAAHFFWGVWAVIQAKQSLIDFDFIEFGHARLTEYFRRKEEFFPLQAPL